MMMVNHFYSVQWMNSNGFPTLFFFQDDYQSLSNEKPKFMDFLSERSRLQSQRRLELDHFLWSSNCYMQDHILSLLTKACLPYEECIVLLKVSSIEILNMRESLLKCLQMKQYHDVFVITLQHMKSYLDGEVMLEKAIAQETDKAKQLISDYMNLLLSCLHDTDQYVLKM
jgi:hypothetical protein